MADTHATGSLCPRCLRWKATDQFYNHKRTKTGKCAACKLCMDFARAFWLADNEEVARRAVRNHYVNNKVKRRGAIDAWKKSNLDAVNAKRKEWREKNRERDTAYTKKWQAKNKALVNANTMRRHARKLDATPSWANTFFIAEAYRLSKLREQICGGKWNVDHIVPLRSKLVCGLHVENNLQIIPKYVNQRKSNISWPDMP